MKLDKLIKKLKKARKTLSGDIEVIASGFVGINDGYVLFDIDPKIDADESTSVNGVHLSISLNPESRKQIVEGIKDMEQKGYKYLPSQFVKNNIPRYGVSPCEWHTPW